MAETTSPRRETRLARLEELVPSPLNPRKRFDPVKLQELAESLQQPHGLIQPLTVRPMADGRLEIVAGERRYRAAQIAGLAELEVTIRPDLDDETMLRMMFAENYKRADLNPIEIAEAIAEMDRRGRKGVEIAEAFGIDASTVSNHKRLLRLPGAVQDLVRSGQLGMSHAELLARIADHAETHPALAIAAQEVVERRFTVHQLGQGLPHGERLVALQLAVPLAAQGMFPECHQCPFGANRPVWFSRGWGDPETRRTCLYPAHHTELAVAAEEERRRRREDAERLLAEQKQAAAAPQTVAAVAPVPETSGKLHVETPDLAEGPAEAGADDLYSRLANAVQLALDGTELIAEIEARETPDPDPPAAPALPSLSDLPFTCLNLEAHGYPEGCTEACACRRRALSERGAAVDICIDPQEHARKERAESREKKAAQQKAALEAAELNRDRVKARVEANGVDSLDLAPLVRDLLRNKKAEAVSRAIRDLALPWDPRLFSAAWELYSRPAILALIARQPLDMLLRLMALVDRYDDIQGRVEWSPHSLRDTEWVLCDGGGRFAEDPWDEEESPMRCWHDDPVRRNMARAFRQADLPFPQGFRDPDAPEEVEHRAQLPTYAEMRAEVTDTPMPADQCRVCGTQLDSDGSCGRCARNGAESEPAELDGESPELDTCDACGDPMPEDGEAETDPQEPLPGFLVSPNGTAVTGSVVLCPACTQQVLREQGVLPAEPADATEISAAAAPLDSLSCLRCQCELPGDLGLDASCETLPNGVVVDRGHVLTPQGAAYCAECRPEVRFCKSCGCTDEAGCPEGCAWVAEDLCSECEWEPDRHLMSVRSGEIIRLVELRTGPGVAVPVWQTVVVARGRTKEGRDTGLPVGTETFARQPATWPRDWQLLGRDCEFETDPEEPAVPEAEAIPVESPALDAAPEVEPSPTLDEEPAEEPAAAKPLMEVACSRCRQLTADEIVSPYNTVLCPPCRKALETPSVPLDLDTIGAGDRVRDNTTDTVYELGLRNRASEGWAAVVIDPGRDENLSPSQRRFLSDVRLSTSAAGFVTLTPPPGGAW